MTSDAFEGRWRIDGRVHAISGELESESAKGMVDGVAVAVSFRRAPQTSLVWNVGGVCQRIFITTGRKKFFFSIGGRSFEVERVEPDAVTAAPGTFEPFALSPMSGLVTKVHVAKGDRVAKGASLFAVEAMKMEYVVKAEREVVIADVKVVTGARIAINDPGVTFEPGSAS